MKKRVQAILDRELARLDQLSQAASFDLDQFRQLELLLRACRTLHESLPDDATPIKAGAPSTSELLDSLHTSETDD